jgi:hypothetical protein
MGGDGAHAVGSGGGGAGAGGAPVGGGTSTSTSASATGGASAGGGGSGGSAADPPTVVVTAPLPGATNVPVSSTIAVTFSTAMNPASLVAQTAPGGCSGSMQLSNDAFTTCIGFASNAPTLSAGDTVATLAPAALLAFGAPYTIRVTTSVQSAGGDPLATTYTMPSPFTTEDVPASCQGSIVVSQIFSGGGNPGAPFLNDFIEIKNRGGIPVDLTGWSVQYAAGGSSTWAVTPLSGTIQPGQYLLVQEISGGADGVPLPTPDFVGTISLGTTYGKVALSSASVALSGACPLGGTVVDFVGYGGIANCFEGGAIAPPLTSTIANLRGDAGCTDTNENGLDFTTAAPSPRNGASPAGVCPCGN